MSQQLLDDEALPPTRPLGSYGQLEADTFCAGCGYNLHGQVVSLDDRLNFLICRCPECGRFHPAGAATSANSVWLSRLGAMLLLVWAIFVIIVAGLTSLAMGALQAGYVDAFSYGVTINANGETADYGVLKGGGYGNVLAGTTTAAGPTHYVHVLTPPSGADLAYINGWGVAIILA